MNSSGLPALPGVIGREMTSFSIPSLSANSIWVPGLSSVKNTCAWESIFRYLSTSFIKFSVPVFPGFCLGKAAKWGAMANADADAAARRKNVLLFTLHYCFRQLIALILCQYPRSQLHLVLGDRE